MNYIYEIPAGFWSLFRSVNRDIYIEALLVLGDEYQYNNYFLSREACVQILSEMCSACRYTFEREEDETEEDQDAALPGRILNWLLRHGWLRKVEDYMAMTVNIVIPDYAAVLIEAFERLVHDDMEDTQVYIQNVYATLFSFKHDNRLNLSMLRTALVNTKRLNKSLQDMLHNMDKFFERLLEQKSYKTLLKEHLEGYVEEVVRQKYHILKTSDNFYIYKMDIKRCLKEMREDEAWVERVRAKQRADRMQKEHQGFEEPRSARPDAGSEESRSVRPGVEAGSRSLSQSLPFSRRSREEDVLDLLDQIERGFDDIEHRIANMDREHSKYVRATVSRLNYLLSDETERHGMLIQLLNHLGAEEDPERQAEKISQTAERMNLSELTILNENPLYKRRRRRRFEEDLAAEEENAELSKEDILRLNRLRHRFTKKQIEEFLDSHMEDGVLETRKLTLSGDEEFEKLILAYDISMRKNSKYEVLMQEAKTGEQLSDGPYHYPPMAFVPRQNGKK